MNPLNNINRRQEHAGKDQDSVGLRGRQCLVVASDLSHRLLLSQAAQHVGWRTIEAANATEGLRSAAQSAVDLAIVDLETTDLPTADLETTDEQGDEVRTLVERLSNERNRLVMVCGNHQQPEEEVWARQLGVWIYVPGLDDSAYEDGADVTALCSQAAEIVDRWLAESEEELCRNIRATNSKQQIKREQRKT